MEHRQPSFEAIGAQAGCHDGADDTRIAACALVGPACDAERDHGSDLCQSAELVTASNKPARSLTLAISSDCMHSPVNVHRSIDPV